MTKFEEFFESLKNVENIDIEKLKSSYRKPAYKGVRINTKKFYFEKNGQKNDENEQNFAKKMQKLLKTDEIFKNVPWCQNGFYCTEEQKLGKSIFHEMGLFYLQEPSAMSPVEFLNVQPNDVVLDLCASPGGKSTQIANKLGENGILIANEIVPSRAKILAENIVRLGVKNAIVTNHSPKELENRFENFFDKILVDAPCSGEGMFRKDLSALDEWNKNSPAICADRQKEILKSAYKMLKCGGTMVYSTCTFSLEENEEVVKFLLDNFDDLEVLPLDHSQLGIEKGNVIDGKKGLENCARLYPYNISGEGHFFAVIHKKDEKINDFDEKIDDFNQKNDNFCSNYQKFENITKKQNQSFNKKFLNKHDVLVFEKFAKEHNLKTHQNYVSLGSTLYASPNVDIDKLKVLTAGICLGEIKNGLFFPDHHLAKSLTANEFEPTLEIDENDAKKYIEGQELNTTFAKNGWVLLTHCGYPLAFGKVVDRKIKNHYPKQLRKKL